MISLKTYVLAGAFAAGLIAGATGNGARLNAKIDRMVSEHAVAASDAAFKAFERSAEIQRVKDEEITKANERAQRNFVAAASARAASERLRVDLARSRTAFASASTASLVEHASTLSAVFEQCTREYLEVAEKADGHASDAQSLFDAWSAISAL